MIVVYVSTCEVGMIPASLWLCGDSIDGGIPWCSWEFHTLFTSPIMLLLAFFYPKFSPLSIHRPQSTVKQLPPYAQGAPRKVCLKDETSPRTPVHCSLHTK